jgi:two-component system sensor histidine kinase QseC
MRSIRGFLMLMLVLLLSVSAAITIIWTRLHTSHEVEEVFDASLAQASKVMHGLVVDHLERHTLTELQSSVYLAHITDGPNIDDLATGTADDPGHPYEYQVGFQVWRFDGTLLLSSPPQFPLQMPVAPGFELIGEPEQPWRSYSLRDPHNQVWIRAGHQMSFRRELTDQVADKVLVPTLVVLPLLLLLLSLSIRRGLRPLDGISHDLNNRRSDDLKPLQHNGLPAELVPVVAALNGLFERVSAVLERERRFTADAAHELRTPLAALRIHLEKLRLAPQQTADLLSGIGRMDRVVEQLLMLARIEPRRGQLPRKPLALSPLCCDLVAQLYPLALARNLQIELEDDPSLQVSGDETLLVIMLRNLIENGIRYTRDGDTLLLRLCARDGQADIAVIDHGPGLDEEARQLVLGRFYRQHRAPGDGAGLGLSIVALIVELHEGQLMLEDTPGGGLTVRVRLPLLEQAVF